MDDSLQNKSIGETVINTALQHAFCRHVRVVERLCFSLTLYNCYIHICYKYCLN